LSDTSGSALEVIQLLADGTLTATGAVDTCRAMYSLWEPVVHAFTWFDRDHLHARAEALDQAKSSNRGPLYGIPVGVKDIFDTAGIPTEYGSEVFRGRVPTTTALTISRLESSGAIVFGKTVTAELAYFAPGPTSNPWNADHTPGGSSMGSAAAVAAGIVPVAVGTQTNGSVIRPAAFCGVVGFKPNFGRLPTAGVLKFSPSLDQLGVFARTVETTARFAAVMAGDAPQTWQAQTNDGRPLRLALVRTPEFELAETVAVEEFDAVVEALRSAGAAIREVELPRELSDALSVHRTIMAAEASQFIGSQLVHAEGLMSAQLAALLEEGSAIGQSDYSRALNSQKSMKAEFARWSIDFDAILTLPALGEAPPIATTGDPRCCTLWTLVGAPALTLPAGLGPNRLPLGIQLVGQIGEDLTLLQAARWCEDVLPGLGSPPSPAQRT
jgi:Asp-tRNA(Asn)/Glu-tRNA(Gln) amidotransferase A subunit family amidase